MEIKYICTYWGQDQNPIEEVLAKALSAGYDGIELNVPFDSDFTTRLRRSLNKNGFLFIAQQWLPPASESVEAYGHRMKKYLNHLASLNSPLYQLPYREGSFHIRGQLQPD